MGIVKYILEEEADRLEKLSENYKQKLSELPRGSISKKLRGGKTYLYFAFREGKKVKFKYIGPDGSPKAINALELFEQQKKYKRMLKQVGNDLKEIQKVLGGRSG